MVALLASISSALADRDGKGRGDDHDRSGGDRGASSRSFSDGNDRSSSRATFKSSDGNRANTDSRSVFRSGRSSDDSVRDIQPPKSFQFKSNQSGSQLQGSREYQVRRPTDDQARDLLNQGNSNNLINKNADRFKDRSPKDRELVDREYKQWQNTWNGGKKDGFDHRDWSGNWRNSDRFTVADRIRRDWRDRHDRDLVFGDNWWSGHHSGDHWTFWGDYSRRYNRPWYWWSWATGPRLSSWVVFGWPTPYYWDYGPGEYIYCDNGAIYVNGRWYEPAPVYYDQTLRLIEQAPVLTAESAAKLEWMPLGVFVVNPDGAGEPEATLQLAVTKDGVIGGTAFDQRSGAAYNIVGIVDKRTQRAVWSYKDDRDKRIMMESSLYNLTQPEATGMVHYSPTDMRVVELVRLQEPGSGPQVETSSTSTLPPPAAAR